MGSSPFYQPPPVPGDPPHVEPPQKQELFPAMPHRIGGPSENELQDWYYELDTIANENIPRHLRERLLDLRDEVYKYMR